MAEASVWSEDEFSCPICLDLLKDVTTLPCGHSFCMACITDCWDQQDPKRVCTCPQCRQTFYPRPVLGRNTVLADVVDKLKRLGLKSTPAVHCYVGPGDVECDVCSGRKQKAVKSCLTCLASYCETHLRAHNDLNPGTRHKVIDTAGKVEDLICPDHDKLFELFCRTDQTCICMLCVMDTHRGHDTVSVAAERTEKQPEVGETQRKFQKIIKEKESHLQDLGSAVKTLQCSADAAVENSERIFTEMMDSIEKRCSEVTKLIRDQERADVSHAEELKETLEQEIAELKMKLTELEQFSQSANNIYFLKSFQSLCAFTTSDNPSACSVRTDVLFESVSDSCSMLKEKLQHELHQGLQDITKTGERITIFRTESETKQDSLE
ncbi:E3 ubiquitin/ISG15 ligase TRIM25-like isoform X2 [Engraulis encrasicolus]